MLWDICNQNLTVVLNYEIPTTKSEPHLLKIAHIYIAIYAPLTFITETVATCIAAIMCKHNSFCEINDQ